VSVALGPAAPAPVSRTASQPSPATIADVALEFALDPASTTVRCLMQVARKADAPDDAPLVLDGEALELVSIRVDGRDWARDGYVLEDAALTLRGLPPSAAVEIVSRCKPAANS